MGGGGGVGGGVTPPVSISYATGGASKHALSVVLRNTGVTPQVALNVVSQNEADSAMYVTSYATGRGALKVSHVKPTDNTDVNASGLSIDLQGDGTNPTAAQGIFLTSTVGGGTTGNLVALRNGNPSNNNLWTVDRYGQLVIDNDGYGIPVPAAGVKVATDGNGELFAQAATAVGGRKVPLTVRGPEAATHNLIGWSVDPATCPNTVALTAGTLYLARVRIPRGGTLSSVGTFVTAAGSAITSYFGGFYSVTTGNLLNGSTDQGALSATGVTNITVPATVAPDGEVFAALLFVGTTGPTIIRGTGNGAANYNLTGLGLRFAVGGTGLTTLPASLGTPGASSNAVFMGVA